MAKTGLKIIKGHYYQLLKSNSKEEKALSGNEVTDLFSALREIPVNSRKQWIDAANRLLVFHGDPIDLEIPEFELFICGALIKFREDVNPMIATDKGNMIHVDELKIDPSQNLIEITLFMIHKKTGLMLLINNRNAGTNNTMGAVLESLICQHESLRTIAERTNMDMLQVVALIEKKSMEKLARTAEIKSMTYTFKVIPDDGELPGFSDDPEDNIIASIGQSLHDLNVPTVSVTYSTGHSKSIFNRNATEKQIRKILRSNKGFYASKCKVIGGDINGRYTEIDFLMDQFLFSDKFQIEPGNKWPPFHKIYESMGKDFINRLHALSLADTI